MMFKNKVVIVTGASSGIGAGTAVAFAREGAKLVIGGRNEENLNKTAKQCQDLGSEVLPVVGELTKEQCCNEIVDKAIEKYGRLDVLVNNAGATNRGNIEKCTITDVDSMFSINVRSVFMLSKRAVPHLKSTKGSIVNVSSGVSVIPGPSLLAYAMAKAAVNQFTKCLAQDLGSSGVRVNAIVPGAIDTPILHRAGGYIEGHPEKHKEFLEQLGLLHALGRYGTSEECANMIVFLASDKASFTTGGIIPVEGGLIDKNPF